MGKRAPEKNRCLTVNLHHDGVFTVSPFEYSLGDEKQITDIYFEELGENESLNVMKKKKKTELGENESLNVNKVTTRSRSKIDEGISKSPKTPVKAITSGEGCSESPNFANSNKKDDRKKPVCGFRPFFPTLKMKTDIREKFLIYVSLGQCKRAKQKAIFDYEGGLKEHYGRLWEYRHAILDSNPRSTCRLDDEETESGHYYFRRIYVCFKGVKEGWLAGCRKVIGLDGCFLKYTCRAMGRDANNQIYPIAWAVVKVENNYYWCWFISLIQEDLHLETGEGLTIISDSHKGLLKGVTELLLNAEHKKAYFRHESKCPNFENGICESFNRAILVHRTKPIITMLEDIRLYIMLRLVEMNRVARNWDHSITPSIRKMIELLKIAQRDWMAIPRGFSELEVRKGHESYGVNIHLRKCLCRMWQLSRIPCVHSVAAYNHMNRNPIGGVDHCYSQRKWFKAYQFSIKPVFGTTMWKKNKSSPILQPILITMPGRPRKNRMKAKSENNSQVPRPPAARTVYGTHASVRVRGRGSKGVDVLLEVGVKVVKIWVKAVQLRCHKEEGEGVREDEVMVREEEVRVKGAEEGVIEAETQESIAANMSNEGEIRFRLGDYEAEELEKQVAEPIVAVTPSAEPIASAIHYTDKRKQENKKSKRFQISSIKNHMQKNQDSSLGEEGMQTHFWKDLWLGDVPFNELFSLLYALENNKDYSVADKMQGEIALSFRRLVRGGVESQQLENIQELVRSKVLSNVDDRWAWDLNGDGEFRVKDARDLVDEILLPKENVSTRWIKSIPIKVNVFAWKLYLDRLPTSIHGKERAMNRVAGSASRVAKVGGWNDFIKVGGIDETGIEFKSSFAKKVGNGDSTSFMVDLWSGDDKLKDNFPRRYGLEGEKKVLVSGKGQWVWGCIREPRGRVEGEMIELLDCPTPA
nr:hypothetical protein [Tanacetum cinerariifolium]